MSLIDTEKKKIYDLSCGIGNRNRATWQKCSCDRSFFNDISPDELGLEEYILSSPVELRKKLALVIPDDEELLTLPISVAVFKLRNGKPHDERQSVSPFIYEF